MSKFLSAALLSVVATVAVIPFSARAAEPVAVQVEATGTVATPARPAVKFNTGQMVYDAAGKALGPVHSVSKKGSPVLMIDSKLVAVPSATLSKVKNKLTTSLTEQDLVAKR